MVRFDRLDAKLVSAYSKINDSQCNNFTMFNFFKCETLQKGLLHRNIVEAILH